MNHAIWSAVHVSQVTSTSNIAYLWSSTKISLWSLKSTSPKLFLDLDVTVCSPDQFLIVSYEPEKKDGAQLSMHCFQGLQSEFLRVGSAGKDRMAQVWGTELGSLDSM